MEVRYIEKWKRASADIRCRTFYGIGIILLTIIGVVLSAAGIPESGKVSGILPKTVMIVLGILLAAEGFCMESGSFGQKQH